MQYHTHITDSILEEQHLYGSGSLGTRKVDTELFFEEMAGVLGADFWDYTGSRTGHGYGNVNLSTGQQQRGNVRYALADHLGNVRSVITDRKLPTQNGGAVDYAPDVVTAQDYHPFGSLMPERQYANASFANNGYRYGFNGKEQDPEWIFLRFDLEFLPNMVNLEGFSCDWIELKIRRNKLYAFF